LKYLEMSSSYPSSSSIIISISYKLSSYKPPVSPSCHIILLLVAYNTWPNDFIGYFVSVLLPMSCPFFTRRPLYVIPSLRYLLTKFESRLLH
jgi:hypothetical protein